jgi:hypothetical protein
VGGVNRRSAGFGKTTFTCAYGVKGEHFHRRLNKAVQQGRRE